ncbi:MAG: GMC family oxidoreductase [Rhodospirillales bacterium]
MDRQQAGFFAEGHATDNEPSAIPSGYASNAPAPTATAAAAATAPAGEPQAAATAPVSRRQLLGAGLAGMACTVLTARKSAATGDDPVDTGSATRGQVEYIVVGSGAGGGPLACNLALDGHKVVLFEGGGGNDAEDIAAVPFFSGFTTEDERIRWDYYVRHYSNTAQQKRSTQYLPDKDKDGVWYPRVGSLGGCTVHSFMVDIYPSDSDWDHIARITGDSSWNAEAMRGYFQQLERCRYVARSPLNPSRHGFNGWQPTEMPDPTVYADDPQIAPIMRAAAREARDQRFSLAKLLAGSLDPNDWRLRNDRDGVYDIPLFTNNGRRYGPRQFIHETAAKLPDKLIVKTHRLVTRVVFEGTRAVGVEYLEGSHLYRADPNSASVATPPVKKILRASREVILAAGSFNTPQLLKLSGIGPRDELDNFGIRTLVNLPCVGRNLQDRYEVGVVTPFNDPFTFAAACRPGQLDDPCFTHWLNGAGPSPGYGAVAGLLQTSPTQRRDGRPNADLLISVALTRFKGYYPGYSVQDLAAPDAHNKLTWLILKAHTRNRGGTVNLRSRDPRDTPVINFHYFEEGTDQDGKDLSSLVDAIEFSRGINDRLTSISSGDNWPGPQVQTRQEIAQWVRDEAWGHHASCSCRIGAAGDPQAVVDSKFRVRGTRGLRIVDASVFPRIPGYFILMPIYMISQKAAAEILKDARTSASYAGSADETAAAL